jgi:hypothetical protein
MHGLGTSAAAASIAATAQMAKVFMFQTLSFVEEGPAPPP